MISVKEITEKYLRENGYDGLYSDYCACKVGDLFPCVAEGVENCMPGYESPCDCGDDCGFHITKEKTTNENHE